MWFWEYILCKSLYQAGNSLHSQYNITFIFLIFPLMLSFIFKIKYSLHMSITIYVKCSLCALTLQSSLCITNVLFTYWGNWRSRIIFSCFVYLKKKLLCRDDQDAESPDCVSPLAAVCFGLCLLSICCMIHCLFILVPFKYSFLDLSFPSSVLPMIIFIMNSLKRHTVLLVHIQEETC